MNGQYSFTLVSLVHLGQLKRLLVYFTGFIFNFTVSGQRF